MNKIQILAGMLANLFTKNPELEQQEKQDIMNSLDAIKAEVTEGTILSATAPVVAPTTAPVATEPVAVAPTVDIAAITASVTKAIMESPEITALKEKSSKWEAYQAAIGAASTPVADASTPPSSTPKELTMEEIQKIHKYAFN